ncbi:stage III sporulation protein AG [Desulfitispora alkaliphila]|uniref:hypothetical protein n=1 Tax=Desulfitispora alkaliphila TaxID=622674 RepID=UPI003D21622D
MSDKENKKNFLNLNKNQASLVTKIIYVIIIAAVLIMLMNTFDVSSTSTKTNESTDKAGEVTESVQNFNVNNGDEQALEQRLEKILGQIHGVGKVNVSLTLESSSHYEYAIDVSSNVRTTEEKIESGARTINEQVEEGNLVLKRSDGNTEKPVIVRETKPVIKGVLVVAEGANDSSIRLKLSRAVETVLGVSSHQVHVVPMGGR